MEKTWIAGAALAIMAATPVLADDRSFDVDDFSEVLVTAGLDVEIEIGDAFSVIAEGSEKALDRLDVDVRGDRLILSQSRKGWERFSPIMAWSVDSANVTVTLPVLEEVEANAGSNVTASGANGDPFVAEASSGADLELSGITGMRVTLEASSGASLEARGTCGHLEAEASSGADLEARDLVCDSAEAEASSGAGLEISAKTVEAQASSGANIDIYGGEDVNAEETSGGDVDVHD